MSTLEIWFSWVSAFISYKLFIHMVVWIVFHESRFWDWKDFTAETKIKSTLKTTLFTLVLPSTIIFLLFYYLNILSTVIFILINLTEKLVLQLFLVTIYTLSCVWVIHWKSCGESQQGISRTKLLNLKWLFSVSTVLVVSPLFVV